MAIQSLYLTSDYFNKLLNIQPGEILPFYDLTFEFKYGGSTVPGFDIFNTDVCRRGDFSFFYFEKVLKDKYKIIVRHTKTGEIKAILFGKQRQFPGRNIYLIDLICATDYSIKHVNMKPVAFKLGALLQAIFLNFLYSQKAECVFLTSAGSIKDGPVKLLSYYAKNGWTLTTFNKFSKLSSSVKTEAVEAEFNEKKNNFKLLNQMITDKQYTHNFFRESDGFAMYMDLKNKPSLIYSVQKQWDRNQSRIQIDALLKLFPGNQINALVNDKNIKFVFAKQGEQIKNVDNICLVAQQGDFQHKIYVLDGDEKPIGFLGANIKARDTAVVNLICQKHIDSEVDISRLLLFAFIAYARSKGCKNVRLSYIHENLNRFNLKHVLNTLRNQIEMKPIKNTGVYKQRNVGSEISSSSDIRVLSKKIIKRTKRRSERRSKQRSKQLSKQKRIRPSSESSSSSNTSTSGILKRLIANLTPSTSSSSSSIKRTPKRRRVIVISSDSI